MDSKSKQEEVLTPTYDSQNSSSSTHSSKLRNRRLLRSKISEFDDLEKIYSIKEVVGKGSFGTVVKAFHKENHVHWAIKIVNKREAGASRVRLVEREILILKLVQHPNIIYLDCVFESAKIIFLVFEFCTSTLAKLFKAKKKRFVESETLHIIHSLSGALTYLHKNDIVHRDLKLENILIANNSEKDPIHIKITDFGLSAIKGGPGHDKMLHEFCGTLIYMAPEVIKTKSYSQQCDVWSMGVIMYVLLFGNFPFFSRDENKLSKLITTTEIDYSALPYCSNAAQDLLRKLLEKNPAFRITAAETEHHHWISGCNVTLTSESSNVLHMMKIWKNEIFIKKKNSTEENDDLEMGNLKLTNAVDIKKEFVHSDWHQSSSNVNNFKAICQNYCTNPLLFSPQKAIPSTSKSFQPSGGKTSKKNVYFNLSDDSDFKTREINKKIPSKQHAQNNRKLVNKLPDFSYVLAKVDTNLKLKK